MKIRERKGVYILNIDIKYYNLLRNIEFRNRIGMFVVMQWSHNLKSVFLSMVNFYYNLLLNLLIFVVYKYTF